MRIIEKSQQIEIWDFDEWSEYYVWLYPPMEKLEKSKIFKQLILMNVQNIKESSLFSQNTESSLEQ